MWWCVLLERLEREKMARKRQGIVDSEEQEPLIARTEIIGAAIALSTIEVRNRKIRTNTYNF